jgi:hypothetical protein
MKRAPACMAIAVFGLLLMGSRQEAMVAQTQPATQPATQPHGDSSDELVETFVLSPIQSEALGMEVPAAVLSPITNGSCRDWVSRPESCYLPAHVLAEEAPSAWPQQALRRLLERHASSTLGAYKVGSLPAGGGSVTYDLVKRATLEHCWLATQIELNEAVHGFWITAHEDPGVLPWQAASQLGTTFKVEVFDEVHDAGGYPRKTGP